MPVVEAVSSGGKTTAGLGSHPDARFDMVVMAVAWLPPELRRNLTVRFPVPETRRTKNRMDGVEELTHSHGLRAAPPPGTVTEWVLAGLRSVLPSPETIFAPFPHDQPLAPFSKLEPWNGV
jgi:hypothetical protein